MKPRKCEQALLARCKLSSGVEVKVGPFFTEDDSAILRRVPRLLRNGYFRTSFDQNPDLVDALVDSAIIEIAKCSLYDAYLFARPEKTAHHYYAASRHVRKIEDLRALQPENGWACFMNEKSGETIQPVEG